MNPYILPRMPLLRAFNAPADTAEDAAVHVFGREVAGVARKPFPLGFRFPARALSRLPPSGPHQTRPLEELDGQDLLRALCRLRLDRKIESLSDLMGADGAYLALLDDRREYFLGTHKVDVSVIAAYLSPDRVLMQADRSLRVDHHTQRDLLESETPASLQERMGWDASAAFCVPWRSDRPTLVVGVSHGDEATFRPGDLACLREWTLDLKRHMNRAHRAGTPSSKQRRPHPEDSLKLKFLHEIVDLSADALLMIDPETGSCLGASRQASVETGLSREELLDCTVMDLWKTMDSRGDWRNLVWRVRHHESDVFHEDWLRTAEGTLLPVEVSLRYVSRPEQDCVLVVSRNLRRVSPGGEIPRRDGSLSETLLRNLPHPLFVKDAGTLCYVKVNPAFEDQLGFPEAEVRGQNDYDLFPDHQARAFRTQDRRVLREDVTLEIDRQPVWTAHRGRRWFGFVKFPVRDDRDNPAYLLGIAREIRHAPDE